MKADPHDRSNHWDRATKRSESRAPVRRIFIGLLIVAACGACVAGFVIQRRTGIQIPFDVIRKMDGDGQSLVSKWQREPCNRAAASGLALQLINQTEYSLIIDLYNSQKRQCGDADEIEPMLFQSQMGLSGYKEANVIADDLVHRFPADSTSYGWRAQAKEKVGDLNGAYLDMEKALSRFPDRSNVDLSVFYDTARLAAASKHPCDAMLIMRDYIAMNYIRNKTQQLETLMGEWRDAGHCVQVNGYGKSTIKFDEKAGEYVVQVYINGIAATMIVDTGATVTVLTADFARRSGIEINTDNDAVIATANGVATVSTGRADKVTLGRSTLANVDLFVQPDGQASYGNGVDGLLGLSFLGNFQIEIADGMMTIQPR